VLDFYPLAPCLSMLYRAQGEMLHLLIGVASFDSGPERRVLSSEVDRWHDNLAGRRATTA
jgi:hypothetical protein